jgi:hypothetical protein
MADEIASHDEVLELLTQKAREGSTAAMIALERALRAVAKQRQDDEVDATINRLLGEGG